LRSPLIVRLDPDLAHVEEEAWLKANARRFRKIALVAGRLKKVRAVQTSAHGTDSSFGEQDALFRQYTQR
jgi:hypothetical protein